MDNAQKAIMIGVGLFITIVVIAAVMMILGVGQDMTDSGLAEIEGLSDELTESVRSTYDQKLWSGSQTSSKLRQLSDEDNFAVYLYGVNELIIPGEIDATKLTRVSKATITGKMTILGDDAGSGNIANPTNAILDKAATIAAGANATEANLTDVLKKVKTSHKYKSILISNNAGKTVGVLFVRVY